MKTVDLSSFVINIRIHTLDIGAAMPMSNSSYINNIHISYITFRDVYDTSVLCLVGARDSRTKNNT